MPGRGQATCRPARFLSGSRKSAAGMTPPCRWKHRAKCAEEKGKAGLEPASDSRRGRVPNSFLAHGRPGSHVVNSSATNARKAMSIYPCSYDPHNPYDENSVERELPGL